jgi:hypothetical protein
MEKKMTNRGPYLGKSRFMHCDHVATRSFQTALQPFDLRRLPTGLDTFKRDKNPSHAQSR